MEETKTEPEIDVSSEAIDAALAEIVADDPVLEGEAPEVEVAPSEPDSGDEIAEPSVSEQERSPEVERALERIRLEGSAPESALEALTALGDDAVLSWAASLEKRGRDIALTYQEKANLQKELEQLKSQTPSEPETTAQTEPATPTVTADLETRMAALAESIGFGEDEQGVLAEYTKAIIQSVEQRMAPERGQVQELQALVVNQMLDEARGDLREEYPALSDAGQYETVINAMQALKAQGLHSELSGKQQLRALMRSASRAMIEPEAPPQPLETEAEKAAKRSGSPMAPTPSKQRKMPHKDMSPDELEEARLNYIVTHPNATIESVKRAFGEI